MSSKHIVDILYEFHARADIKLEELAELIEDEIPDTENAVPVVRCKDCKYWKHLHDVEGLMFCQYVIGAEFVRNEDDYCSRGERKDV